MSDFLYTKDVFEKKVEKGMEYGFTFNDFDSIRKMKNRVSRMDQSNPEVRALYSKICSLSDKLFKEGGAHKFSKKNREYILSHCLLLPLVLRDCNRLNVDIMGDQVITDVSFEVSKPITMRELDNVYLEKRVDHSRIEELYPDKPELILTPASYL